MDPETGTSPAELLVAHCVEQGYPVRCAHSVGPLSIIIAACAIARVGVRPTPPPCLGPELWAGGLLGSHSDITGRSGVRGLLEASWALFAEGFPGALRRPLL